MHFLKALISYGILELLRSFSTGRTAAFSGSWGKIHEHRQVPLSFNELALVANQSDNKIVI